MKNSKCSDEYNIVKWDSLPYTIRKGHEKSGYKIGDVVVKTTKLNRVNGTINWFIIGNKTKIVKLNSVVHGNIKFEKLINDTSFPQIKHRKKNHQKKPYQNG